jgi:predicted phosphoribosyltransferase
MRRSTSLSFTSSAFPVTRNWRWGAIASGGARVLNDPIVRDLRIPDYVIDRVAAEEGEELARRERAYRGGRPPLDVRGRTVILVDDGLATGATMRAAVKALRQREPARIIVAVPTASPDTCEELRAEVDEVVCAITPQPFYAVGYWYEDFTQTTDQEVRELLARAQQSEEVPLTASDIDSTPHETVRAAAHRLTGDAEDYDPLMELIGNARLVLLGEASHGTHEFYHERAQITRRLIEEKGSRPSRSRRIGPMPTAPTALFAASARILMPWKRSPISGASRDGCGATPRWWTSSSGCGRTTMRFPPMPKRRVSTVSISTACTPR